MHLEIKNAIVKGMFSFFSLKKYFLEKEENRHTTKVILHINRQTQKIKIQNLIALINMIILGYLGKDIGCSTNNFVGKKLIQ